MKTIRTTIARWLASRDERKARTTRRALRDTIRHEEASAQRHMRLARARRLYVAWLGACPAKRHEDACAPLQPSSFDLHPSTPPLGLDRTRAALASINLVRRAA